MLKIRDEILIKYASHNTVKTIVIKSCKGTDDCWDVLDVVRKHLIDNYKVIVYHRGSNLFYRPKWKRLYSIDDLEGYYVNSNC